MRCCYAYHATCSDVYGVYTCALKLVQFKERKLAGSRLE